MFLVKVHKARGECQERTITDEKRAEFAIMNVQIHPTMSNLKLEAEAVPGREPEIH